MMAARSPPSRCPASEETSAKIARGRGAGGDRRRHAPQRGLLLGHPALLCLELARAPQCAAQELAAGDDDAADQAVDRHHDDEVACEVALDGVGVVEQRQRVHDSARQPVGQRLPRRGEERRVDDDQPQVVEAGESVPPVTRASAATMPRLSTVERCDRRTGPWAHGTGESISTPHATANAAITATTHSG